MVDGIDKFKDVFKYLSDQFVIIGGTACDYIMSEAGLDFRRTRDIDMVLLIEVLKPGFFEVFWQFVNDGEYETREKSSGKKQLYRFIKPKDKSFPYMIELFAGELDSINVSPGSKLTPIPAEDELASLSAILLIDEYYEFIKGNTTLIDELPVITVECIIPLKARAWIDLNERKNNGEKIDSNNVKKHRNDIVRLSQLLIPGKTFKLLSSLEDDMNQFIEELERSDCNPKVLEVSQKLPAVVKRIRDFYNL